MTDRRAIRLTVNGAAVAREVETCVNLADFLRRDLALTGTHVGCEHGVCGACTVLVDGRAVRSCLMFAVQAAGREVTTIEGLAQDERMRPFREAMQKNHGLQCGFCTPGVLATVADFLSTNPTPTRDETRIALTANLCRCTGYKGIVDAVAEVVAGAAAARRE
jgi:carbon-monoxide dehydrogenase small subunit